MYEITTTLYTETAHVLREHPGRCSNIHGHSYRWEVTIGAEDVDNQGMIVDFSDMKKIMNSVIDTYDHSLVVDNVTAAELGDFAKSLRMIIYPVAPTAENMTEIVFGLLERRMPEHVKLIEVTVYETVNNKATYKE